MNPDTRVSVHCYEGDGHQVRDALTLYLHHGCPVTVFSPVDSPVMVDGVVCRHVGRREGSIMEVSDLALGGTEDVKRTVTGGKIANERQRDQMRALLDHPENFFLMNDADSFCLSPDIPEYLYREPDVLWSNVVHDPLTVNEADWYGGLPFIALQPPYFMSRWTIEKLLEVADSVETNERIPWIDHYLLQLAIASGIRVKGFRDSVASALDRHPANVAYAVAQVQYLGRVFVHSAKSPATWAPLIEARRKFVRAT